MANLKNIRNTLIVSIISITITAGTFLFMPLSSGDIRQTSNVGNIICGAVFWLSLILGYVMMFIAYKKFKLITKAKKKHNTTRIGLLNFFSNKAATIVDFILIISLVLGIILQIASNSSYFMFILAFIFYLTLNLHCILNGKIYRELMKKGE